MHRGRPRASGGRAHGATGSRSDVAAETNALAAAASPAASAATGRRHGASTAGTLAAIAAAAPPVTPQRGVVGSSWGTAMVNSARNIKVGSRPLMSPGQAAIRATSGAPLPMPKQHQQSNKHARHRYHPSSELPDERKQPQLTQFDSDFDNDTVPTPRQPHMSVAFAAINVPAVEREVSDAGASSSRGRGKHLADGLHAAQRSVPHANVQRAVHHSSLTNLRVAPAASFLDPTPDLGAAIRSTDPHQVEAQSMFDQMFRLHQHPALESSILASSADLHLSAEKKRPAARETHSSVSSLMETLAHPIASGKQMLVNLMNSFKDVTGAVVRADSDSSAASAAWEEPVGPGFKAPLTSESVADIVSAPMLRSTRRALSQSSDAGNAAAAPAAAANAEFSQTAAAKPRHSLRDVIQPQNNRVAVSSASTAAPVTRRSSASFTAKLKQSGAQDNPISLDDDDDSQMHSQQPASQSIHLIPAAVQEVHQSVRDMEVLNPAMQREQEAGRAAAARGDYTQIDCITAVRANEGRNWHMADRALYAQSISPRLTFRPEGLLLEWSDTSGDEAGQAANSRLAREESEGTTAAVSRSNSAMVPPSPGGHPPIFLSGPSDHGSPQPDGTTDRRAISLEPLQLRIPLSTILRIEIERYKPFRITVFCHEPFFLPSNKSVVSVRAAAASVPPAMSRASSEEEGSLRLCVEFDNDASVKGESYHAIKATAARYKDVVHLLVSPEQQREKSIMPVASSGLSTAPTAARTSKIQTGTGFTPLKRGDFHLVYPPSGKDQVVITSADLALLLPQQFLNDSLVDFALKHVWVHLPDDVKDKFYFFNSFFYTKWCLAEEETNANTAVVAGSKRNKVNAAAAAAAVAAAHGEGTVRSAEFQAVARWTRGVDIFSREFLVIPINENLHWSLAIVCHPALFFQMENISKNAKPNGQQKRTNGSGGSADEPALKRARSGTPNGEHKSHGALSAPNSGSDAMSAAAAAAAEVELLEARDPLKVPAILYIDSLLPVPPALYRRLTQYLREAWVSQFPPPHPRSHRVWHKPPYIGGLTGPAPLRSPRSEFNVLSDGSSTRDTRAHHVTDDPLYEMRVPEQRNGCDCGLFLIEYTERFCRNGPELLKQYHQAKHVGAANNSRPMGRLGQNGSVRFEDIFFKAWKSAGSMSGKRKQLLDLIKREERMMSEREAQKKQQAEQQAQTNHYKSLLLKSAAAVPVRSMESVVGDSPPVPTASSTRTGILSQPAADSSLQASLPLLTGMRPPPEVEEDLAMHLDADIELSPPL